jgi:hypothetical protein
VAFHEAVQADGERARDARPRLDLGELVALFDQGLTEEMKRRGRYAPLDPADVALLHAQGAAMLEAYTREIQPRYHPTSVEGGFEEDLPHLLDLDPRGRGFAFRGAWDALCLWPDPQTGELLPTIIDHKTGKPWDRGAEHISQQATAYFLAALYKHVRPQPRQAAFIVYSPKQGRDGRWTASVDVRLTRRGADDLVRLEHQFAQVAEELAEADTAPGPPEQRYPATPDWYCGGCEVHGSCPTGLRYLAQPNPRTGKPRKRWVATVYPDGQVEAVVRQ